MTIPLHQVWAALEGDPAELPRLQVTGPPATLRSTFAVTEAATAGVGASMLAATLGTGVEVGLDTRGLAVALRSERHLLRDGRSPGGPFDPLSAFHRTTDGWLRMHANYPWHRAAALQVLDCAEAEAPAAIAQRGAVELETALHAAGGVGTAVRTEPGWRALVGPPPAAGRARGAGAGPGPGRGPPAGARPHAGHRRAGGYPYPGRARRRRAAARPARPPGAGPAVLGRAARQAQRAARPGRPGPTCWKSCWPGADVVVTGYRPGALDRYGLGPGSAGAGGIRDWSSSRSRAWGYRGPWAGRRGFDSLVQAACGIAVAEGSAAAARGAPGAGARPRHRIPGRRGRAAHPGPAAPRRRQPPGPAVTGRHRGLAATPATRRPGGAEFDPAPYRVELDAPDGRLTLAAPPGTVDGQDWPGRTAAVVRHRGAALDPPNLKPG